MSFKCSFCGHNNSTHGTYCSQCGRKIIEKNKTNQEDGYRSDRYFMKPYANKYIMILEFMLCMLVIIVSFNFFIIDGLITVGLIFLLVGISIYSISFFRHKISRYLKYLIIFTGIILIMIGCYHGVEFYKYQKALQPYVMDNIVAVSASTKEGYVKTENQDALYNRIIMEQKSIKRIKEPVFCKNYERGLVMRMTRIGVAVDSGMNIDKYVDDFTDYQGKMNNKSKFTNILNEIDARIYEYNQKEK
ncbi:hypothetical protein [Latilactobacillus sakei]|uniref:hypothetical protein n=1 Tax=Latilactobacillus sakei TaxID=1599 RepID=UPI002030D811|nr:hypothetical protein [Latilactobacillus sakei]MCM1635787.1 hypothetical protein [Latilactobacillus sakei]MCP8856593.1 hypothetical protein [Latilactobacillus sakei]